MCDINKFFKMLSWNSDIQTQEKGLELARKVQFLDIFFQPIQDKSVWDNCAIILSEKTDEVLLPYLPRLLEWIQDINWPGAITILNRLKIFSAEKLHKSVEDAVEKALYAHDDEWLDYLSILLENSDLKKRLSKHCLNVLESHCYNC